jgi:hypothetical protein
MIYVPIFCLRYRFGTADTFYIKADPVKTIQ